MLGKKGPKWNGKVRMVPEKLDAPLRWRKPRSVFVNSMSDLFHEDVSDEYIAAVFGVMAACPQHTFQVLTKRAERMRDWFRWVDGFGVGDPAGLLESIAGDAMDSTLMDPETLSGVPWPLSNVWLGVSVEDQPRADERIPLLMQCPAAVRWISAEPLLGPINLRKLPHPDHGMGIDFGGVLDWVVAGGESGPGHRTCDLAWLRSIAGQCQAAGVPCFMKQTGSSYRDSDNSFYIEHPHAISHPMVSRKGGDRADLTFVGLNVREFPTVAR